MIKKYINKSTKKIIEAEQITIGELYKRDGIETSDINPDDDGYYSVQGSLKCWEHKKDFENKYCPVDDGMSFGYAIELLKSGFRMQRKGWNGKGMFVVYQKGYPDGIPCNKQTAEAWGMNEGDLFKCNPYLQIKQVDGSHSMWVPSIGDVLAEDWVLVE